MSGDRRKDNLELIYQEIKRLFIRAVVIHRSMDQISMEYEV